MKLFSRIRKYFARHELIKRGYCPNCLKERAIKHFADALHGGWYTPLCGACYDIVVEQDSRHEEKLLRIMHQ